MHNFDSAAPVLTDCVFSENKAAKSGGGMGNVKNSAPEMTGCSFVNNRADDLSQGGGAIASTESAPKITECSFSGNSARVKGGALYSYTLQGRRWTATSRETRPTPEVRSITPTERPLLFREVLFR